MAHGLYQLVIVNSVFGHLVAYTTVQALKGTEYTIYAVIFEGRLQPACTWFLRIALSVNICMCVCLCMRVYVCAPRLLITSGMI